MNAQRRLPIVEPAGWWGAVYRDDLPRLLKLRPSRGALILWLYLLTRCSYGATDLQPTRLLRTTIATDLEMSTGSVMRALQELQRLELLELRRTGRSSEYLVMRPPRAD